MSNAHSLVLLPPRQTAPAAVKSDSVKATKPADKTAFSHKLEKAKAKSVKPAVTDKKPAAAIPQKPAPATAPAKPQPSASAKDDGSTGDQSPDEKTARDEKQLEADQNSPAADQKSAGAEQKAKVQDPVTDLPAPKKVPPLPKQVASKPGPDHKPPTQQDPKQKQQAPPQPAVAQSGLNAGVQSNPLSAPAQAGSTGNAQQAAAGASAASSADDISAISKPAAYGSAAVVASRGQGGNSAAVTDSSNASDSGAASTDQTVVAATQAGESAQPQAQLAEVDAKAVSAAPPTPVNPADIGAIGALPPGRDAVPLAGKAVAAAPSPQAAFVQENQPKIVSGIAGQLLPHGGTMQIRLNPAELGSMQVTVHMRDGVMSASFETTSDHATKLLSHSLGQLKSGLEATGVHVEKLQVEQAPKQDAQSEADSDSDSKQPPHDQQQQAQQDQQRREMVQRMWRKLAGGDPLDMVA